jgi:hypothetical protein
MVQVRVEPAIEERIARLADRIGWSKNATTVEILRRGIEALDRAADDHMLKPLAASK